jgi:hypothetical protein
MRRVLAVILAAMLDTPASAFTVPLMLKGRTVVPSAYTGPGDLKTYAIWGGLYAYSAATRGTKAVNICNVGDAACADVNSDATTGIVPVPTIGGVLCGTTVGVDVCTVKTWYDKTGNSRDLPQTVIAWRATFVPNCGGLGTGVSCASFPGSTQGYTSPSINFPVWTASFVGKRTGNFSVESDVMSNDGGTQAKATFLTANTIMIQAGVIATQSATDNAWHMVQGVNDPGNLTAADSTVVSQSSGTHGFDTALFVGDVCLGCGAPFTGNLVSFGLASSNFSSGDLTSINSNAHTILGF